VHMSTNDPFSKKITENCISKFHKNLKINHDVVSIVCQMCKFSTENSVYFGLRKINKYVDLNIVIQISKKKNRTLSFLCSLENSKILSLRFIR
jgi:hypothetical protein